MRIPGVVIRLLTPGKQRLRKEAVLEERRPVRDIRTEQWNLTRKIIRHAYENTDFYRKKFEDAGITPDDIRNPEDMGKIPFTTKEELRKNFPDGLLARGTSESDILYKVSSGSTGKPFPYYEDLRFPDEERKALFRVQNVMGLRPGDVTVRLRNSYIRGKGFGNFIARHLGNTKHISTRGMSMENMQKYVRFIKKHKPKVIESFPHHILELAKYMNGNGIVIPVSYVYLVGGNANDYQRRIIQRAFKCRIYNDYGLGECMRVAYQCEKLGPYHMEIGRYYAEIVRNGKPAKTGEIGEIVLTNLYNYAMPFIRYRTGDLAEAGDTCSCGRSFPTLNRIVGRTRQAILLPDGTFLDPNTAGRIVGKYVNEIDDFQIVYTKKKELILRIKPTEKFRGDILGEIVEKLRQIIKGSVPIRPVIVEKIDKYGAEDKSMELLTERPPDFTREFPEVAGAEKLKEDGQRR